MFDGAIEFTYRLTIFMKAIPFFDRLVVLNNSILVVCLSVLALVVSGPLNANAKFLKAEDSRLETMIVTGRQSTQPLKQFSNNVERVSEEDIRLIHSTHINESADRVSGVWISRGNGQENLTAIRSPVFVGAGSCGAFVMAEDGIAIRPAGFCNVNQLFEINSEQAGNIEILKGPSSAVYGSNAVHGVINVNSRAVGEKEETNMIVDAGPHDFYRYFLSHSNGENIRVGFHLDTDGGYKDDSGFTQQKFSVKQLANFNDAQITNYVTATNLKQETAGYIEDSYEGEDAYKNDDRKKENNNPEAFRDAESFRAYSRWQIPVEEGELIVTPYMRYSKMEFVQHWMPGNPLEKNGQTSVGLDSRYFSQYNGMNTLGGFVLEAGRVDMEQSQTAATVFGRFTQGDHYDFDVGLLHAAWFAEMDYALTTATTLLAGVRYDYQYYDYDNHLTDGNSGIYRRPGSDVEEFGAWAVNMGLVHNLSSEHSLFVNLSSGFRIPQIDELYRLQGGVDGDDIEPEKIINREVGLRGEIDLLSQSTVFYQMSFFDMDKQNVILKDSNRLYLGDGQTSHRGVELLLQQDFLQWYYWQFSATYAEHRYKKVSGVLFASTGTDLEGNIIDTAPRHMGSLQIGRYFSQGRIELEVKHMGNYFLDPEHDYRYSGHNLLNLRGFWDVTENLSLSARLMNLLDEDYAERADVTVTTNKARYFVGEPRSLYVSAELTF